MTIRSLRTHVRPDNLKNQVRPSQSLARKLYLGVLLLGAGWIGMQLFGSLVFMDAEGLVVQDREVVTAPFAAHVSSMSVKPGDTVKKGQRLGTVVSTQMLNLISDLTAREAQTRSRRSQIAARLHAITATLPAADKREDDAAVAMVLVDRAKRMGYATVTRQAQVSEERYAAVREVAGLRAERAALLSEQAALNGDVARIRATLTEAEDTYNEGVVVASVDGTIGSTVVAPGTYMSPGDNYVEIHHGKKYVIAYLPTNRLYSIAPGDEVAVTDGVNRQTGRIERVEVIADKLPAEFQTSFRGVDRRQVFRVALDSTTSFPVLAKIKVTNTPTAVQLFGEAKAYVNEAWTEAQAVKFELARE